MIQHFTTVHKVNQGQTSQNRPNLLVLPNFKPYWPNAPGQTVRPLINPPPPLPSIPNPKLLKPPSPTPTPPLSPSDPSTMMTINDNIDAQ